MSEQTHNTNGRPYAKLSELKAGDIVELDTGFTCHTAGKVAVCEDKAGLFFECGEGHHYFEGQTEDGEHCVGIFKASP